MYLNTGDYYYTSVDGPKSIDVQIIYDPTSFYSPPQTVGDTSIFTNVYFQVSIQGSYAPYWPGFDTYDPGSVAVTAPAPGGGLDQIVFTSLEIGAESGIGTVTILAPNGTLHSSTELPATLNAFERYGKYNFGGEFRFTAATTHTGGNGGNYDGEAGGTLGALGALPEPASVVLMSTGMSLAVGFTMALKLIRHRRLARTKLS